MPQSLKNKLQRILLVSGYTLHRVNGRSTLGGALEHLQRSFLPKYIIDGGASDGRWSLTAREYFPDAHCILVEPLAEHRPSLEKVLNARIVAAALASAEGTTTFNVTNLFNSSIKGKGSNTRTVPTVPLDSLLADPEHTLVKLDLEEAEYEVLAASENLVRVPAVIVECAFNNLPRYCALMESKGFLVREIFDLAYHSKTSDMRQCDILFMRAV